MKKTRLLPVLLAAAITFVSIPMTVFADTSKVVTLGANLTDEQKASMYEYFGADPNEVTTIEVTNADERKYMEGIASEAQIGTRTLSCSYVEPTEKGGIQVKVANLTYVTSSMIASTLLTSGVENCNVVAACPIAVSGTGALTGIMMAYESATGEELNEDMKETATEELIKTGELAEQVGSEDASELMTEVKNEIINGDIKDEDKIRETIVHVADKIGIELTDAQIEELVSLMSKIANYDYDKDALRNTLKAIHGTDTEGFINNLISGLKNFFTGSSSEAEGGIINDTNDEVLGDDTIVDSTIDKVQKAVDKAKEDGTIDEVTQKIKEHEPLSIIDKFIDFCKSLFNSDNWN